MHSSKSNLVLRGPRAPFSAVLCSCSSITFLYSGAFEKGNPLNQWTICLSWVDCTIDLCRRLHLIQRSLRLWEESLSCGEICPRQFLTHLNSIRKWKQKHTETGNMLLDRIEIETWKNNNFKFQTFKFQTTNKNYPSKSLQVQRVTVHQWQQQSKKVIKSDSSPSFKQAPAASALPFSKAVLHMDNEALLGDCDGGRLFWGTGGGGIATTAPLPSSMLAHETQRWGKFTDTSLRNPALSMSVIACLYKLQVIDFKFQVSSLKSQCRVSSQLSVLQSRKS